MEASLNNTIPGSWLALVAGTKAYRFESGPDRNFESKTFLIIFNYKFNKLTNITYEKNSRYGYVSRIMDGL